MKPFLQDVLQFAGLLRILTKAGVQDPLTPFKIVPHVGLLAMGYVSGLGSRASVCSPVASAPQPTLLLRLLILSPLHPPLHPSEIFSCTLRPW